MYASAWICTKMEMTTTKATSETSVPRTRTKSRSSTLEEIDLGLPMIEEGTEAGN